MLSIALAKQLQRLAMMLRRAIMTGFIFNDLLCMMGVLISHRVIKRIKYLNAPLLPENDGTVLDIYR